MPVGVNRISQQTWIHRIVTVGVRPIVNSPVTPNHLTTLRLITGLAAAGFYGIGELLYFNLGSGLFILSMLLDRADGVLARLSGKTSEWGHKYDLISDVISNVAIFIGLGFGLRNGMFGIWAIPMGILAGFAVAAVFSVVIRLENEHGAGAGALSSVANFDADDAMAVIPITVLLGWNEWLLIAATIGAPVFALFFLWHFRKRG